MMLDLDAYAFRYLCPYTNTRNEQMDTNGKAVLDLCANLCYQQSIRICHLQKYDSKIQYISKSRKHKRDRSRWQQ